MAHIATFRALSYVFGRSILRLAGGLFFAVSSILLISDFLLAHYVSAWWLLLLIPVGLLIVAGSILYAAARFILARLYPHELATAQRHSLTAFNEKILRLLEARSLPPFALAGIVIKDLIVHRELKSLRGLLDDSKSLKQDFAELEKELDNPNP